MKIPSATESVLKLIDQQGDRIARLEEALRGAGITMPTLADAKAARDRRIKANEARHRKEAARRLPVVRLR